MKKSLPRLMAKRDPEAYGFWKRNLSPALGKSLKKTDEAILVLRKCAPSPFSAFQTKHRAIKSIARRMQKYQNTIGASITFGFLLLLCRDHRKKILQRKKRGSSK